MSGMVKSELQRILATFNRPYDLRATKAQLIAALNELKADIESGTAEITGDADNGSDGQHLETSSTELVESLQQASLSAWVMKPLVTTAGMREGSLNEIETLKAMPSFFAQTKGAFARSFDGSSYSFQASKEFQVKYVRNTGLLESARDVLMADSPDAVASIDNGLETVAVAVEVKTMTAIRTIEAAKALREKYAPITELKYVGTDDTSTAIFHELVNKTDYRTQVLHHAVTLGINRVLFVVASGGSMTAGRIIYCCIVEFSESTRHAYSYALDCVRLAGFKWVGKESAHIPKEYDRLLKESHASDLFSFVSYYNLSQALRSLIEKQQAPISPCRMIRIKPTVYWNHLKGGVDVMSRYLRTVARTNISENPVGSILVRLLSMQVNNAAVVYRTHRSREMGILPKCKEDENGDKNGYSYLRHKVSNSLTFGRFVRLLAQEWRERNKSKAVLETSLSVVPQNKLIPTFPRNAVRGYNQGIHKARRLNTRLQHETISAQATYCVLCSWTLRGVKNGKSKIQRKDSRQVQWCSTCKQAICFSCWSEWHAKPRLKRACPSSVEIRAFEQSLSSVRQRNT